MTKPAVRKLLILVLIVGLAIRFAGMRGGEGVVAWVGGILMIVAFCGLIASQFLRDRGRWTRESFFFDSYWKWGLVLTMLATLLVQGITGAETPFSSILAGLFWVALFAFVVQTIGRWVSRWRHRGASRPEEAGAER